MGSEMNLYNENEFHLVVMELAAYLRDILVLRDIL
jgi:hypothetical protein